MQKYVILVKCGNDTYEFCHRVRGYYGSENAAKKGLSKFRMIAGYYKNFEKEIPVPFNGVPEIKKIA